MEGHILFLADAFIDSVKQATSTDRLSTRDILLAATVGLVIALGLFVWVYVRFQNRRRERGELIEGAAPTKREREKVVEKSSSTPGSGAGNSRGHRRKRRRIREHRPSNPTLQQTGGLPPPRPDDQLPKY